VRHVTGLAPASGTTVAFPETKTLDSPDHYTVGWIAALFIERAAATALLDERHDEPQGFSQHLSDTSSYT
jgi:hypothetical protein